MFGEAEGHEEMRQGIMEVFKAVQEACRSGLETLRSPENRLAFIREDYLPIVAGLAEVLEKIKP